MTLDQIRKAMDEAADRAEDRATGDVDLRDDVLSLVYVMRSLVNVLEALPACADCDGVGTRLYERTPGDAKVLCDDCHPGSWHAEDLPYAAALRVYLETAA